jgi:hypothetical protein
VHATERIEILPGLGWHHHDPVGRAPEESLNHFLLRAPPTTQPAALAAYMHEDVHPRLVQAQDALPGSATVIGLCTKQSTTLVPSDMLPGAIDEFRSPHSFPRPQEMSLSESQRW